MTYEINDIWKKWNELKEVIKHKKIILWGRSEDWVHKTLPKLSCNPVYMIDSNPGYEGETFNGLTVYSPKKIKTENKEKIYIIITAGPYQSVSRQLIKEGFKPGKHFACSPEYYDFRLLEEINNYRQKILISSADYQSKKHYRYSKRGGGLYLYDIFTRGVKKILPGHFRQMIKVKGYIYAIEFVEMALYKLKGYEVIKKFPLAYPNACGLTYHKNQFYISNAATDEILIYDEDIHFLKEISFAKGAHINDLCFVDKLFVSYFSFSGNWKKDIFDGGIAQYSGKFIPVIGNLWMPHSPEFINKQMCYLDSMRGDFYIGNRIVGHFPGFIRGLTYDDRFYYIGQSIDMYSSKLFGLSNNIMQNAGFYLFDTETKVSRFYDLPDLLNIHDLLVW